MCRYNAVLFDVDGTLIHSQPGIVATFAATFKAMGLDPEGIDLRRYLGPPLRWSFAQHFPDPEQVEQAVTIYRELYARDGMHRCTVYPGVEDMLKKLRNHGTVLGTATSKPAQVATAILEEKGLLPYFDVLGGASMDNSIDSKTAVIRQALRTPAMAGKQVLMAGDRQDDMQGAANCGLPAAGVLYGYGSREELSAWNPVLLEPDCNALVEFVLNS